MKKRMASIILAGMLTVSLLGGCGGDPHPSVESEAVVSNESGSTAPSEIAEEETPASGGTFHDYISADVDTINGHMYRTASEIMEKITLNLYRDYPNEDGTAFVLIPELAEAEPKQMDDEGKIWQIPIRKNAKWQNGDPINADDVIYSFQMCLDPNLVNSRASQMASDYITITNASDYSLQGNSNTVSWDEVGIKKIDDYTIELQLDGAVTAEDIKSHMNYNWCSMVHKPTYEAGMNEDRTKTSYGTSIDMYMSCGAYIMTEWIPGSVFILEKNPDYVLADRISIDRYTYNVIGDQNTALELYLNGELDTVTLSADAIEQYIDDPGIRTSPADSIATISINLGNTDHNGILGNVNFRKALFLAMDRESIAKMTNGIPANYIVASKCLGLNGTFRDMPEAQEYLEPNYGYDPERAKLYYDKAMEECGLTSLTLELGYNETSAGNKAASEYLQKELPQIFGDSFSLELMAAPSSVLTSYRNGWKNGDPNSYELQWKGWNTSTPAPWNGMKVYTSSYSNKNEPYYNEEYDAIWEEANNGAEAKMDPEYRLELVREMEKIILDDAVACPVYETPSYSLISPKVHMKYENFIPGYGFGFIFSSKED